MSDTQKYTAFSPAVEPLATGQNSQNTRLVRAAGPPSRNTLPEVAWLDITQLQVDHSYQHRPYSRAIEDLRRRFHPEHSGFILVNTRGDGTRWIIDGQTRRAVHELLGLRWIRAEILKGLSDAQEAEIYLLKCLNTQRVPVDFFLAELKAQQPMAVLLNDILAQRNIAVESYATEHQHRQVEAVVSCIATLRRLLRRDPDGTEIGEALDLIIATWGYHRRALGGQFIETIHGLMMHYGDDIDKRSFSNKLGAHGLDELHEMARNLRHASTPQLQLRVAMQRKIIELYNVGRQTGRIAFGA